MPPRCTPTRRAPKKRTLQKPKSKRHSLIKRTTTRIKKPASVLKRRVILKQERKSMQKQGGISKAYAIKQPHYFGMRHQTDPVPFIQAVDLQHPETHEPTDYLPQADTLYNQTDISQLDAVPVVALTAFDMQPADLPHPEPQPESYSDPLPEPPVHQPVLQDLEMTPEYKQALTLVPESNTDLDFILNTLSESRDILLFYDKHCFVDHKCFARPGDSYNKNILKKIKKIQDVAAMKKQFDLGDEDLDLKKTFFEYTLRQYKTGEASGEYISAGSYLFARLISYVKTLSKLTGLAIDYKQLSGDIYEQYFNLYKNKPISEESKTQLTSIMEHVSCESKKQTVYHFYLTRDYKLIPDEHQPILKNNNSNISYNVVFIKQTEHGYEPIDITCDYDTDTVLVMSSIGSVSYTHLTLPTKRIV